jgi:hypothetical protein
MTIPDLRRAEALKRQRRARVERRHAARAEAVKTGKAKFVSVAEYCLLTGLSPATIYRRIGDGTLAATKIGGKSKRGGKLLIEAGAAPR